jgi:hypothetical protein
MSENFTWNNRLLNRSHRNNGEPWVEVIEVYYDENGKPEGFSKPLINGEKREVVVETLEQIIRDIKDKPVLNLSDFGIEEKDDWVE